MKRKVAGLMTMASVAAGTMVNTPSPASAGPGNCQSDDVGCTSWYKDTQDQYRFNSSDSNLSNNFYVTEACGTPFTPPCVDDLRVENHNGRMRMNSAAQVRMCIYANHDYKNVLYWVTQHNIWATTGQAAASLHYWQANSC